MTGEQASNDAYTYIWEYRVKPDALDAFLEHYRAGGPWAELFRRAEGYLGTELLQDRGQPDRYVTIDRWSSAEAFDRFRAAYADAFEALDRRCESFTVAEREIGRFGSVEHRAP